MEANGSHRTNAGTLGLKNPEVLFDAEKFADEVLRSDRAEIVNRPDIGLSMLIGSLAAHKTNLCEGLQHGFFGAKFVNEFTALWNKYDMDGVNRMLNIHDHPNLDRSEVWVCFL